MKSKFLAPHLSDWLLACFPPIASCSWPNCRTPPPVTIEPEYRFESMILPLMYVAIVLVGASNDAQKWVWKHLWKPIVLW